MFNRNISFLRKKFNYTQEELAKKLNITRQTVSKWENGEVVPDSYNLIEISKLFSVKVQDLIMTDLRDGNELISDTDKLDNKIDNQSIENVKSKLVQNVITPKCNKSRIAKILISLLLISVITLVYFNKDYFLYNSNKEVIDTPIQEPEEEIIDYSKLLSAGREFSVYIDQNGKVVGFGDNTYKQLNVGNWYDIVQISAGGFHTLGLKSDGTVVATGYNNFKQLDVNSWINIKQVSGGRYHSLGLREDGTVLCVGENKYGACNVSSWTNIVQVSAGRYNSYGLKDDGTVISTQDNEYGQANISNWTDISQVSAGTYHVIGLKTDGTVLCAGGQKGDGACNVTSWSDIKQVVGAGYHSIGLKKDGTVVAAGSNGYGQINTASWENIEAIAGGRYHTLGVNNSGKILAIGSNEQGQTNINSIISNNDSTQESKPKDPIVNKDIDNFIISFETNDGSKVEDIKLERGSEFKAPSNPTKNGYVFAGWYSNKELTDYFEFPKKIESDLILYADWGTEGLEYKKLSDGTYSVSSNISNILNVKIPNRHNNLLVTEIDDQGFANSKINKITLSQSIRKIGSSAFKGTNIQEITITKNVEVIKDFAFQGLILENITFEAGSKIKVLTGLNSIKRIKKIMLPEGITEIGEGAFRSTRIDYIKISDTVTTIRRYAFSNECNKESVYNSELCSGNTYDYEYDLRSSIEFGENSQLKTIEKEAFTSSDFLKFSLPKKLESIGEKAFYNNYRLESIYIPKSVTFVSTDSFAYSYPLIKIQKGTDTSKWGKDWDVMIRYDKKILKFNIEWVD